MIQNRMVVDMKNKNALITNAMLASYLNEKQIDYLGMIEPFILRSLPEDENESINIESITKIINKNYGLDIKQKIVEKILNRLSKDRKGNIVRRESVKGNRLYYVNKFIDHSKFDNRKERMENLVSDVVTKLMEFINDTYAKKTNYDEAQKSFVNFLNDYNYELYSTTDNLRRIQASEKHNSSNFRVAKFILSEYAKKEGCYNKIKEIQTGYFASVAMYYFCNSTNIDNPIKLINNTSIILDTRLLIDVLGLNRSSEAESMKELLTLIKDNGGKLCTFDYYVDELDGIIKKYLYDSKARLTLDLDLFRRNKYSNVEILTYKKNLKQKIEHKKITIIEDVDYKQELEDNSWHIDELELKRNMLDLIGYDDGENDTAYINDYNSMQAISYYKYKSVKYNDPKSIFVTSNNDIIHVAKKTFKDRIYQDDIGIVISDIDLAAVLWLSNYNAENNLPDLILLENAYAAICPDKSIINKVIHVIDNNIQSKDEDVKNNALLLRYNEHLLKDIADITQNDESAIGEGFYNELSSRMKNRVRKEVLSEETQNIRKKLTKEIHKEYEDEYQNRLTELEMEKENAKLKQLNASKKEQEALDIMEKSVVLQSKNNKLHDENKNLIAGYEEAINFEINKCENRAKTFKKLFQIIFISFISVIVFYVFLFCMKNVYYNISTNWGFSNIVDQIIIAVSTLLTFSPVEIFCVKNILKLSNSFYDYIYQKMYKKSYILNNDIRKDTD